MSGPVRCRGPEFCCDDLCASSDVGMCGIPHPHTVGELCSDPYCLECMEDPDDGYCPGCSHPGCPDCGEGIAPGDERYERRGAS